MIIVHMLKTVRAAAPRDTIPCLSDEVFGVLLCVRPAIHCHLIIQRGIHFTLHSRHKEGKHMHADGGRSS